MTGFRYADVAADIGFLAMDLDFYALDELSNFFCQPIRPGKRG
jgi:aminoglycoside phosphotransferase family enzyme